MEIGKVKMDIFHYSNYESYAKDRRAKGLGVLPENIFNALWLEEKAFRRQHAYYGKKENENGTP
jgi:hypothetical protein